MKNRRLSELVLAATLAACSDGGGDGDGAANTAAVASAGPDQSVAGGSTVQLDGTATDADNDTLTVTWSQVSGTTVALSSTSDDDPTFTAPDVSGSETLVFEFSVNDGTAITTDSVTITVTDASATGVDNWIVNTSGTTSNAIMDGGSFVEVNVLSVTTSDDTVSVETNSIPGYTITITQPILDWYNDYQAGAYSTAGVLTLGDVIEFGEDIGLTSDCDPGGDGWWPGGGGACADSEQGIIIDIPTTPVEATDVCATGAGPVGLWVNGVFIYNWTDTFSYNNEGVWNHYAVPFRWKGMDVCLGHAGGGVGQYHHHSYNECLRQEIGDEGAGHSAVYGYAGDGYPIHGPYHADGVLAQSCWTTRDYSAGSVTGCGTDGERSCQFVDQTDTSQGRETVAVAPTTSDSVSIDYSTAVAVSGFYLEDYYYEASCTAQGDEYLDQHNGHDHDDRGYHYHTSVDVDMLPTFPLAPAVQYRGEAGGSFACSTDAGGMPGSPPG